MKSEIRLFGIYFQKGVAAMLRVDVCKYDFFKFICCFNTKMSVVSPSNSNISTIDSS